MRFFRAHGVGNDYLVLESGEALSARLVTAICDRHRGLGADGILEPRAAPGAGEYGVTIWNPDGSIAEKSGNGLRIFARFLRDRKHAPEAFSVDTGFDRVTCRIAGDQVRVGMGRASFEPADVPVRSEHPLIDAPLSLSSGPLTITAVGLGNPHCVVFREEPLDALPWRAWGQEIESHPAFPNRTNVQVARVLDRSRVELRIWERGAGATAASGSSSCAVAAAGVRTGRLDAGRIVAEMPGGELLVTVDGSELVLQGPVEPVGTIELFSDWLEHRGGSL